MSRLPHESIVRAARRWIELLEGATLARADAVLRSEPYNDLTPFQYLEALSLLRKMGLLDQTDSLVLKSTPPELALLNAVVTYADPFWLADADRLIPTTAELPADVVTVANCLEIGSDDTLAVIRSIHGKLDRQRREEIGAAGESALVEILADIRDLKVLHVSAFTDSLGYDIAISSRPINLNLEVKTTNRRGRLTIYLSRNEFDVMCDDPTWRLVVVLLDERNMVSAVGTLETNWLRGHSPYDSTRAMRWESARVDVPSDAVTPGISGLREVLVSNVEPHHVVVGGTTGVAPAWLPA